MRSNLLELSRVLQIGAAFLMAAVAGGCGSKSMSGCKINSINVFPVSATVNHAAVPPGNTQHFDAFIASEPNGCFFTQSNLTNATWSVSDTTNVSISNVQDSTYGTATCKAATAGAITVTATVPAGDGTTVSKTASLTCN